jgi:hypothetical protein
LIELKPLGDRLYAWKILSPEQKDFDFIEVIFNPLIDGRLRITQFKSISRSLDKAILFRDNIPFMSPELIIFCKAMTADRSGYQLDFDITVPHLTNESKEWLIRTLEESYPAGHPWLDTLKT